jgi:hypothetical protein
VVLTAARQGALDSPEGEALKAQIPNGGSRYRRRSPLLRYFSPADAAKMIDGADLLIDGGYTDR